MTDADLPIIDISGAGGPQRARIAGELYGALNERGFMYLRGHGIDPALIAEAFMAAREFFERSAAYKRRFAYTDIASNFGYQDIEGECLDPGGKPDLKESFTMRNALALANQHSRWPDGAFRETALALYAASLSAAYRLMNVMTTSLGLQQDFFTLRHLGENVTLRFLHYPANLRASGESQLGAGAHTDYGSITLLFQDDVGGLELCDAAGQWRSAPPIPGAAVINTGDLMERWTNGRFVSTVHRVRPVAGSRDRYSIAMFVDPDTEVAVDCIPSCLDEGQTPRYPTITAGEHLQQKIAATHG